MNILIMEDEANAALRMRQLIFSAEPDAHVVGVLETVKEALAWFRTNEPPDLALSDIQLADGLSLDVFRQINTVVPVIFTTAFDAYTLQAFKLNSIDYLLKPIDAGELQAALDKYHKLRKNDADISGRLMQLIQHFPPGLTAFKSRFLVKQADRLMTIAAADVAFVRADDKVVFLHTRGGDKYIIDDTLDELEKQLDPKTFFRISRTYIAPLDSIVKINNHFNGRLKITLAGSGDNDIFVSRARAGAFKEWLNK